MRTVRTSGWHLSIAQWVHHCNIPLHPPTNRTTEHTDPGTESDAMLISLCWSETEKMNLCKISVRVIGIQKP
ncbi:hypothetical protein PILCRDRAFT_819343, partial [Piloderma croceum F 1598]